MGPVGWNAGQVRVKKGRTVVKITGQTLVKRRVQVGRCDGEGAHGATGSPVKRWSNILVKRWSSILVKRWSNAACRWDAATGEALTAHCQSLTALLLAEITGNQVWTGQTYWSKGTGQIAHLSPASRSNFGPTQIRCKSGVNPVLIRCKLAWTQSRGPSAILLC
jgi:hypothetical protein